MTLRAPMAKDLKTVAREVGEQMGHAVSTLLKAAKRQGHIEENEACARIFDRPGFENCAAEIRARMLPKLDDLPKFS